MRFGKTAGHVFVMQGDLTRLGCDGWLLPVDGAINVRPHWTETVSSITDEWALPRHPEDWDEEPGAWGVPDNRVIAAERWPAELPPPWLTEVGRFGVPISWYVEGARQFLQRAVRWLSEGGRRFLQQRARPLLALPLVGTGWGGARRTSGKMVEHLLPVVYQQAQASGVDIVLVTREPADYAAAQAARRKYLRRQERDPWPELSAQLRGTADTLALRAARGELVTFIGAGVSFSAGLPDWDKLLLALAQGSGLNADQQQALARMGYLDRAQVLAHHFANRGGLGHAVARELGRHHCYALSHGFLASLPVSEVVTTNYDQLFEVASRATGRKLAVLPYAPTSGHDRWLLKMHGCVLRPEDIVLTREDYLRYDARRAALAGIVQALLITKHILFVGFSLNDDNFHRIADAVRQAIRPGSEDQAAPETGAPVGDSGEHFREPFGTCVTLFHNELFETLWKGDMAWVRMLRDDETRLTAPKWSERIPDAARRLEIFLDYLAFRTVGSEHLLQHRFSGSLTDNETELKRALLALAENPAAQRAPQWAQVERLLRSLGARDSDR